MKDKFLHTFSVDKFQKVKESVTEINDKNEEVTTSKEVEKKVPQKFTILNPSRKLQDDANIFYSVKVSEGIKLGLVTKNYLIRQFQKDGILASESEKKEYADNYSAAVNLEVESEKIKQDSNLSPEEKELSLSKIDEKYRALRQKIADYEVTQSSLFDNTAEKRASDLLNLWFIFHLVYQGEDGSGGALFGEGSFDQRMDKFNSITDSGDEFLGAVIEKSAYIIGQLNAGVPKESIIS